MNQLNGVCCFGKNIHSLPRSNFISIKESINKGLVLRLPDPEFIDQCELSLNGKAIVLAYKKVQVKFGEYPDHEQVEGEQNTHFSFFMFYEGYLSSMYTKIFSPSTHYSDYLISSDYTFAVFIDQSVFEDNVSFSMSTPDYKKYSKVTPGKLFRNVYNIQCGGKLLYHPVYCLSPDSTKLCFVMNGIIKNQNRARFCELYLLNCHKDEEKSLSLLQQKDIFNNTDIGEIHSCLFNTKCDKLLLLNDKRYGMLCLKRNTIIAKGSNIFKHSDLYWTVHIEHGEYLITVERVNLNVKIYTIHYTKERLEENKRFSLTDHIPNYSYLQPCIISVSSGISGIFAGVNNKVIYVNPFSGQLEGELLLDGVQQSNMYMVKNILSNWPGMEVLVRYANQTHAFVKVFNITYPKVFSLKFLSAICLLFNYSVDDLCCMNIPKTLRQFLNF